MTLEEIEEMTASFIAAQTVAIEIYEVIKDHLLEINNKALSIKYPDRFTGNREQRAKINKAILLEIKEARKKSERYIKLNTKIIERFDDNYTDKVTEKIHKIHNIIE